MQNIVEEKSYLFAVKTVKLCKKLEEEKTPKVLTTQILKSGTSIGANISEAQHAQSKKDFIAKIHISLKEATETKYWIRLLHDTGYLSDSEFESLLSDIIELEKIIVAIAKTAQKNSQ